MDRHALSGQMYFQYVKEGIAVFRPVDKGLDFVFVDINQAGLDIVQCPSKDSLLGKRITECFPGVSRDGLLYILQRIAYTGGYYIFPPHKYADSVRSLWVRDIVFRTLSGELVVIFEDLSEYKRIAEHEQDLTVRENWMLTNILEDVTTVNDSVTGDHIHRVTAYAECLAEAHHQDPVMIEGIRCYASLHDIGKVGLETPLLQKDGAYTEAERTQMQRHVTIGADILRRNGFDRIAINIAQYHHERWDGTGYVEGLRGREIPIEARVVSLVDYYDALMTVRPYKPAFSRETTEDMIVKEAGRRFDPALVAVFSGIRNDFYAIYLRSNNGIKRTEEDITPPPLPAGP